LSVISYGANEETFGYILFLIAFVFSYKTKLAHIAEDELPLPFKSSTDECGVISSVYHLVHRLVYLSTLSINCTRMLREPNHDRNFLISS
jgi:hypothetical protein